MIPFRCILLGFHEHDHDHDQSRGVGVVIPDGSGNEDVK